MAKEKRRRRRSPMQLASTERLTKDVYRVLETPFWLSELNGASLYSRIHDDHDGTYKGVVSVIVGPDGDLHINTEGRTPSEVLRFRTFHGGGRSLRVLNALMILALAIKLDNEEYPDGNPG